MTDTNILSKIQSFVSESSSFSFFSLLSYSSELCGNSSCPDSFLILNQSKHLTKSRIPLMSPSLMWSISRNHVFFCPLRPAQTSRGPQRRERQECPGPSRPVLRARRLRPVHEADGKPSWSPWRRWHRGHIWGQVMMMVVVQVWDNCRLTGVCICRWGRCGTWLRRFWVELWTSETVRRRWSRWMFTRWVCSTGRASGGALTCSQVTQHERKHTLHTTHILRNQEIWFVARWEKVKHTKQ